METVKLTKDGEVIDAPIFFVDKLIARGWTKA